MFKLQGVVCKTWKSHASIQSYAGSLPILTLKSPYSSLILEIFAVFPANCGLGSKIAGGGETCCGSATDELQSTIGSTVFLGKQLILNKLWQRNDKLAHP